MNINWINIFLRDIIIFVSLTLPAKDHIVRFILYLTILVTLDIYFKKKNSLNPSYDGNIFNTPSIEEEISRTMLIPDRSAEIIALAIVRQSFDEEVPARHTKGNRDWFTQGAAREPRIIFARMHKERRMWCARGSYRHRQFPYVDNVMLHVGSLAASNALGERFIITVNVTGCF